MPLDRFAREAPIADLLRYAGVDGLNLLTAFVLRRDLVSASALLDRGFPTDENNWGLCSSALTEAARIGFLDGMAFLLAHGANVNGHEHEDLPPLHMALFRGQHEAALFLLEHGAEVNRIDDSGKTALDWAADAAVIERLMKAGAKKGPRS